MTSLFKLFIISVSTDGKIAGTQWSVLLKKKLFSNACAIPLISMVSSITKCSLKIHEMFWDVVRKKY